MTSHWIIASEVRAYLSPQVLAGLEDIRRHTEIDCRVCHKRLLPESKEPGTVSLVTDPIQQAIIVRFAHARCAHSHADVTDLPADIGQHPGDISYVQGVMDGSAALLIWERNLMIIAKDPERGDIYPYLESYRAAGFARPPDEPRLLAEWTLTLDGHDLLLSFRGEQTDTFEGAAEMAPPSWFEIARETGICQAVVGFRLGLDRPTPDRLDQAEDEGRVVSGLVQVEL